MSGVLLPAIVAATDTVDSTSSWIGSHGSALVTSGIIIVVAVVLNWVLRHVIRKGVDGLTKVRTARRERVLTSCADAEAGQDGEQRLHAEAIRCERVEQRARTLGSLLRYATTIMIATIALLMVLSELGIDIAPLIAGAGVAGIALGFGAQSLVKDFLSGMFMLMEDQYGVGDIIDVGEATGTVEQVTLRVTTLRDVEGTVWYVANGEIRRVGNKSQLWSRIVLDVEVAYDTDIEAASAVIVRVAEEEWRRRRPCATIIERPELWGVERFDPSAIVIRLAVKTRPGEQWAAGRALRASIKTAFDDAGIVIPFPQQTVWLQERSGDPATSAPSSDGPEADAS